MVRPKLATDVPRRRFGNVRMCKEYCGRPMTLQKMCETVGGKSEPVYGQSVGDAGGDVGDAVCVVSRLERGKLAMDGRGGR